MLTTLAPFRGHYVISTTSPYWNVPTLDPYFLRFASISSYGNKRKSTPQLPPLVLQRWEVVVVSKRPAVSLRGNLPRPQWRLGGVLDTLHKPGCRPLRTGQPCAQRRVRHAAPVRKVALRARPAIGNEPCNSPRQVVSQHPRTRKDLREAMRVNVRPVGESVSRCKWESHELNASHP